MSSFVLSAGISDSLNIPSSLECSLQWAYNYDRWAAQSLRSPDAASIPPLEVVESSVDDIPSLAARQVEMTPKSIWEETKGVIHRVKVLWQKVRDQVYENSSFPR